MPRLEKYELLVIASLIAALLLGLYVLAYKTRRTGNIEIKKFDYSLDRQILAYKEKIDINEAPASDLARLNGIGVAMAERIVAYRDSTGRFVSTEDIKKVKGIGGSLFNKIKDDITT